MSEQNYEPKVATEVALEDLKSFLRKHKRREFKNGTLTDEIIKQEYPHVIEAIEDGLLKFVENEPITYTLRDPLYSNAEDSSLRVTEIKFRERITEQDKRRMTNGVKVEKEQGTFILKFNAYCAQLSNSELNKLEKDDYLVVEQISSVF